LHEVFNALHRHRVVLEHILLKPSMVLAGSEHAQQSSSADIAAYTVRVLKRTVPSAVPGVVFLSGGQSPEEATANLDAMNRLGTLPWNLSFSYGRALQEPPLQAWRGQAGNLAAAQQALLKRARLNGAAALGKYDAAQEKG
jgi:fructose-bisphosphate aldolase class I